MKKVVFSSLVVAGIIFSASLTSCDLLDTKYTVRFDSKGGTPTPQEQTIKEGGKVDKPADPTLANHQLKGWATADNASSSLWNFDTDRVTADITLYARWALNEYAVTFNSNGGQPTPLVQNIAHGSLATKPANPTRAGYEFDGWFNGDTEWNFTTAITAPITLTAKWTAVHIVTFDSDGGSTVPAQTIRNGNTATKPATDPTKDGFEFDGWFVEDTKWDFATAITAPITLKAKWTAVHVVTFDSDGGSTVSSQTIRNGETATKPAEPTRTIPSGLYLGTPSSNYTFDGWYNGDTKWDFATVITAPITLKAKWSLPGNATRIESVFSNDIAAAVTYVNTNSFSGEDYTLLIGTNITAEAQTLNGANAKLTIIGIGTERTINTSFTINGNNVTSLTLGNNITLKNGGIYVRRGSLTMRDGSKITECGSGAVDISGSNASFKMEGGEISGFIPPWISYGANFCVYVSSGATFEMSGGRIFNSSSFVDVFISYDCIFRLSGNARIGELTLDANNATTRSSVTIVGNYSGTVTRLHLTGDSTLWTNVPVVISGTPSVINMFNNGLGNFLNTLNYMVGPISATHVLNADGFLVLKED